MSLTGRLHAAAAYGLRLASVPKHPHRLVVEISNACNLRCVFCPRTTSMDRPIRFMNPDDFDDLLRNAGGTLENVSLNGYGEPLLHPRLTEFIEIAHRHGAGVSISTNCTLLDETRGQAILKAGIDHVTLAIDGIASDQYEAVRVGGRFDKVLANARRFLELKRDLGKRTFAVVQCIAMVETKDELRSVHRFWRDQRYDAIRIRQLTHTGDTCGDEQFRNAPTPCYWLWTEPMLLADGRLVPCCQDVNGVLTLGNVGDQPLDEIWSGKKARKLREMHAAGRRRDIPFCRNCNMYMPSRPTALAAALLETNRLNRWVPLVETIMSWHRYR